MIFNEIYSAYYNTVARILKAVIEESPDEKDLSKIVCEYAFGESALTVLPSLKSEKWQLLKRDMTTPVKRAPSMPLTLMQKRWLKSVSLDPRIKLFGVEFPDLSDVEPLFSSDDYFVYDRYADGDPYDDEKYREHFQTALEAIRTGANLKIEMVNRRGLTVYSRCVPQRLEYSEKDDKFRLVTSGCGFIRTVNLAKLTKCKLYHGDTVIECDEESREKVSATIRIWDERNTLERCLLHFAHFEKQVQREGDHYLLHMKYDRDDESEIVIRVLSFGPTVEVIESESLRSLIIAKLKSQKSCELF